MLQLISCNVISWKMLDDGISWYSCHLVCLSSITTVQGNMHEAEKVSLLTFPCLVKCSKLKSSTFSFRLAEMMSAVYPRQRILRSRKTVPMWSRNSVFLTSGLVVILLTAGSTSSRNSHTDGWSAAACNKGSFLFLPRSAKFYLPGLCIFTGPHIQQVTPLTNSKQNS